MKTKRTIKEYHLIYNYGSCRWYLSYDGTIGQIREIEEMLFSSTFLECFNSPQKNDIFFDFFQMQKIRILDLFMAKRTKKTKEPKPFMFCDDYNDIEDKFDILLKFLKKQYREYTFELEIIEKEEESIFSDPTGKRLGGEEYKLD